MRADKDSIDYQVNLAALQEMEEAVPMTLRERRCLRKWVLKGNEIESNPWNYMDSDGMPLNGILKKLMEREVDQMETDTGYLYTDVYHILPSAIHLEPESHQNFLYHNSSQSSILFVFTTQFST